MRKALIAVAVLVAIGSVSIMVQDDATTPDATSATETPAAQVARDVAPGRTEVTPDSVVLDFSARTMAIHLALDTSEVPANDTVWVWAFFVNPAFVDGSWSDEPIAVAVPHGTATVKAVGGFHWATNSDLPRSGYMARVYRASTAALAPVRASERNKQLAGMVRVISR